MAIQLHYSEKDIEDLLADDCRGYLGIDFLSRQVRTPVGVIDILAKDPERRGLYYVVEIKKGPLDAWAFTQVSRYAKYLNSERSREGRRLFVPVLVGAELSDQLVTLCEYFEQEPFSWARHIGVTYYRLFDFDPKSGVRFDFSSPAERDFADLPAERYSHAHMLAEQVEYMEYMLRREPVAEPAPHSLRLLSSNANGEAE